MTNAELLDRIEGGNLLMVTISKDGIALIVDGIHHIINDEQAEILWNAMPLLAAQAAAKDKR